MSLLYPVFWWVHASSAIVWLGGIFFMMAVAIPSARTGLGEAGPMAAGVLGKNFSPVADRCIALLVLSGTAAYISKSGLQVPPVLPLLKLVTALTMISVHYYRGKVLGPRISRAGEMDRAGLMRLSVNMARVNLLLGFVIVFVSGALVRA